MNFYEEARKRIIVALDVDDIKKAVRLVEGLSANVGYFKVGLQLIHHLVPGFPSADPDLISTFAHLIKKERLILLTKDKLMWDAKFHDIHTTMRKASEAVAQNFSPAFFTVHASAGYEAIQAVARAKGDAKMLAVMIPTTMSDSEIKEIYGCSRKKAFLRLVTQAIKGNAEGLVLNPNDITLLDEIKDKDVRAAAKKSLKVGVGVRPTWADKNDQFRSVTPGEAIHLGADFLVIGRPITNPPKAVGYPEDAVQYIIEEIARAIRAKKECENDK